MTIILDPEFDLPDQNIIDEYHLILEGILDFQEKYKIDKETVMFYLLRDIQEIFKSNEIY